MKVLISAYACEPDKGSEPGVGWNWVQQITRSHEAWIITRENNRDSIHRAMADSQIPNAHFIYVDLPAWARFWKRGSRGARLYYYLWQIRAYFSGRKLNQKVQFDLGHHVTFVNDWMPSFLCLLPFPFVWGPVGGSTHRAPVSFWREFGFRGFLYEIARTFGILVGRYLDPFVWMTRNRASVIIAMSEGAVSGFPASVRNKVLPIGNVGFSIGELPEYLQAVAKPAATNDSHTPIVFTAGRLVHWKGYSVLLKSCAAYRKAGHTLQLKIGGTGPDEARLRRLAKKLGIDDCVTFLGRLPDRDAVFDQLNSCDIFVMPTFHDGPPVVFLEAMAVGKPVICLDLGGPSEIITSECGVKLAVISLSQVINDLAEAINRLGSDAELRGRLGAAARERIRSNFNWEKKGDTVASIYQSLKIPAVHH